MRGPVDRRRIPHVDVLGSHVEVAADRHRLIGIRRLHQPRVHARQPLELGDVELAPDHPAVGHVDAYHPDPGTGRRHETAAVIGPAVVAR